MLKVEGLATKKLLHDISFEIRKGEILGFAGLMGAGRTEVARCVFGADPRTAGEIWIHGRKVAINTAADGVRNGIGYLSEDRKQFGLLLEQDIKQNAVMAAMKDFNIGGFILDGRIRTVVKSTAGGCGSKPRRSTSCSASCRAATSRRWS